MQVVDSPTREKAVAISPSWTAATFGLGVVGVFNRAAEMRGEVGTGFDLGDDRVKRRLVLAFALDCNSGDRCTRRWRCGTSRRCQLPYAISSPANSIDASVPLASVGIAATTASRVSSSRRSMMVGIRLQG
jgi:hypothetical protein